MPFWCLHTYYTSKGKRILTYKNLERTRWTQMFCFLFFSYSPFLLRAFLAKSNATRESYKTSVFPSGLVSFPSIPVFISCSVVVPLLLCKKTDSEVSCIGFIVGTWSFGQAHITFKQAVTLVLLGSPEPANIYLSIYDFLRFTGTIVTHGYT